MNQIDNIQLPAVALENVIAAEDGPTNAYDDSLRILCFRESSRAPKMSVSHASLAFLR
jgi:hypothetical protein